MNQEPFANATPLFILGIARSGTTLLQSLLDGHPQLLVDVGDSRFCYWYKYQYRMLDGFFRRLDSFEKRVDAAESILIDHYFNAPSRYYQDFLSYISIPELKKHFRALAHASGHQPKDILESYSHALGLASCHLTAQTRYWVDKTLGYEYLFYRYAQWWPNARFIYVVRDPRDVYTSYKKRDIRNQRHVTSMDYFALAWGNSARSLFECERLPSDRRLILHYEDMVRDSESVMRDVAHFLDIEFRPSLLSPTKGFGRVLWGGNAESGQKQFGVYQDAARKWKSDLSFREVTQIESLLHVEMTRLGYELSGLVRQNPLLSARVWARRVLFSMINFGL